MTTYRVIVGGELGDRFAYVFEGMSIARVAGTTVLTGEVRDKAHLHALIEQIEELNLEIVSMEQVSETGAMDSMRRLSAP